MRPTIRLATVAALPSALTLPAQAERRIERRVHGLHGPTVDRSVSHALGAHARSYARTGALIVDRSLIGADGRTRSVTRTYGPTS